MDLAKIYESVFWRTWILKHMLALQCVHHKTWIMMQNANLSIWSTNTPVTKGLYLLEAYILAAVVVKQLALHKHSNRYIVLFYIMAAWNNRWGRIRWHPSRNSLHISMWYNWLLIQWQPAVWGVSAYDIHAIFSVIASSKFCHYIISILQAVYKLYIDVTVFSGELVWSYSGSRFCLMTHVLFSCR